MCSHCWHLLVLGELNIGKDRKEIRVTGEKGALSLIRKAENRSFSRDRTGKGMNEAVGNSTEVKHCFQEKEAHYPGVPLCWDFHLKTSFKKDCDDVERRIMA